MAASATSAAELEKQPFPIALDKSLIAIFAVWAVLYCYRPFVLGFYHDDWWSLVQRSASSAPFSIERMRVCFGANLSRPVQNAVVFLLTSICGSSPVAYQMASILFVLGAAISMYRWLSTLSRTPGWTWMVALSVCVWLSIPWLLGVTAWPVASEVLISQILFTEALRIQSNFAENDTTRAKWNFAILLSASLLMYEAFYFQIFLALLLHIVWGRLSRLRKLYWAAGLSILCQLLGIGWNRLIAAWSREATRQFNPAWKEIFRNNLARLPMLLQASFSENRDAIVVGAQVLLGCGIVFAILGCFSRTGLQMVARLLAGVVLGTGAVVISSAVYALAGYGFTSTGLMSRTLLPGSWAAAVIVLSTLSMCLAIRWRIVRQIAVLIAIAALVVLTSSLGFAQVLRVEEWEGSWHLQKEILETTPVDALSKLPENSAVLFIGPWLYKDRVIVFQADWDISGAVFDRLRKAGKPPAPTLRLYAAADYHWSWDGATLSQILPRYWTQKFPAEHLYIWDFHHRKFFEAMRGFELPYPAEATK